MTPATLRDELVAKLQAGGAAERDRAEAFRQRILGGPPADAAARFKERILGHPLIETAKDRGDHLLGTAEQLTGIGRASRWLGLPSLMPSQGEGGVLDLSRRTQQQLRADDLPAATGTGLVPMDTPLPNIQAAPTLEAQAKQQRPGGGGGAGGPGAGAGLKGQLDAARAAQFRTLEEERELTGQLGIDRAARTMALADINESEAARQMRLAEEQKRIDEEATARHQAFLARSEQLAEEIGRMKVDPNRMMRNADANTKIGAAIGGILGGGLAALNGGPNNTLEQLDRMIQQDIQAQHDEIDNKKAALSARNSLFGQMLQETGDRRLAAQQTRVMMLEAAKLKIQSDADRLGIPEMRTNAELAVNQIQQKIDAAKTQLAKEAYESFQRQAAAAAAARARAEERAWQRSMDVAKLGLERDKMEVDRLKAMGLTGEDINKQTAALASALSDKDLAQGREAVENAKRRLASAKPDEGLPGVGLGADIREKIAARPSGLNVINPLAWGMHAAFGLSDQEKVSRGDWEKIKLAYQSQITGSGASEKEREMLSSAFEGAKTPAEQRNAIAQADAFFARREAAIKAGYDPRAVALFEQRLQGYRPTLPDSVKVKK